MFRLNNSAGLIRMKGKGLKGEKSKYLIYLYIFDVDFDKLFLKLN